MAFLEVWGVGGRRVVALVGTSLTVGAAESNDIVIAADTSVSRLHVLLEQRGPTWCIRDPGSRNGTFLNGERIFSERSLRPDDELRLGRTRMVFRGEGQAEPPSSVTEGAADPPAVTARERDVLVALCRPLLAADVFTEPASIRQVSEALVVSDAAVKQHLARLYDKFGVYEGGARRRVRLANEALRRGVVSTADLRHPQ